MASRRKPAPPPEIPGFRFERHLGSGGFSDVYLYEQQLPRRMVAVKVLFGGDDLDDTSRRAFIGEANLMAQLSSHPYIVTIFHADIARDGRPYFVMEHAPGRSLASRCRAERIPVEEALRIGVRIASAVATAHAAGILHRDIKPANVLTNALGWPALTDFGISSAVDDELAHLAEPTSAPHVGMSVPWSPPELFEDEPQPGIRSEVFSLGATLYSLIAGRSPFEIPGKRNGTIDLMGRIQRGEVQPIDRDDVPPLLIAILRKSMATRPEYRFTDAVEFARALQSVELGLGYSATPIEVPNLRVDAPERPGNDDAETTSGRAAPAAPGTPAALARPADAPPGISLAPVVVHGGRRASEEELTSTRHIARLAAQRQRTPSSSGPAPARVEPVAAAARAAAPPAGSPPAPGGQRQTAASAPSAPPADAPAEGIDVDASTQLPSRRALRREQERLDEAQMVRRRTEIQRSTPRDRVVGLIVGIVVAVLMCGAIAGVVIATANREQAQPTTVPVVPGGFPPSPVTPTAVRAPDGMVTFAWVNPDEQPGDVYFWRPADGSGSGRTVNEPQVTLGPYAEGERVCISVEIRRNGKVSAEPLIACHPQE